MGESSEALALLSFLAGTLLFVLSVVFLLSFLGGWRRLAHHYRARTTFTGRRFRFQSLQLRGWCGYNGCITAGADPFELRLAVWPLFRIGHPPLAIPWREVSAMGERRGWVSVVKLSFDHEARVPLRISRRLARRLAREARGSFTVPDAA